MHQIYNYYYSNTTIYIIIVKKILSFRQVFAIPALNGLIRWNELPAFEKAITDPQRFFHLSE